MSLMTAPAANFFAITPSNTATIRGTRCLYVGVAGDLKVRSVNGHTETFTAAFAGYHPLQVDMVYATGTAATNILGLW